MSDVEIRTELLLEGITSAKADLAALKDHILNADKAREQTQKGFGDWLAQASQLANTLGVNVSTVISSVRGVASEFIGLGASAETGDHAIAALMSTASGYRADVALAAAGELGDKLNEIAFAAGVAGGAVGDAFQLILERTGASEESLAKATMEVEKLALISGKLGKNTAAITSEYSFMLDGQLQLKGQLFQLLQSTGVFGDHVKKIATGWAAMTEEKRAAVLAAGLDKLTTRMRDMPVTFAQASASFENVMRLAKEDIGRPIAEELSPILLDLVEDLKKMRPELQELGQLLAKELGVNLRDAGKSMKEALSWIRENKGAIAADIKDAAHAVRKTFEFVLQHKEEIAIAFGVKAIAGSGLPGAVGSAGKGIHAAGKAAFEIEGSDALKRVGMNNATGATIALSAAIVGLGLAAEQATLLIKEQRDVQEGIDVGKKNLAKIAATGDVERVENVIRTEQDIAKASGQMTAELGKFHREMLEIAIAAERTKSAGLEETRNKIKEAASVARDLDAMSGTALKDTNDFIEHSSAMQVATLTNAYNVAVKQGDQSMALLAAQAIASGQVVGNAFLQVTKDVEGGFDAMAEMLIASGGQFAGFASMLKGKTAAPPPPKISMPGAKITVNQNFRQQDPDRVAVVFKRDIARQVERRTSARYSGIFGS